MVIFIASPLVFVIHASFLLPETMLHLLLCVILSYLSHDVFTLHLFLCVILSYLSHTVFQALAMTWMNVNLATSSQSPSEREQERIPLAISLPIHQYQQVMGILHVGQTQTGDLIIPASVDFIYTRKKVCVFIYTGIYTHILVHTYFSI